MIEFSGKSLLSIVLFSFSKDNQIEEKAKDVPNEVLKGAVIKWVRRKRIFFI